MCGRMFPCNDYNKLTKLWIKYANKKNKTIEEEFYNYLHYQLFDTDD
ncbi:MAG: hypothetical protein Terrestrivirus2_99 [Terrestrivirus sp.]|jgi:hypothetical protein|uniref:Uncharacterized protein n=1 Tax=Terrestrivirus sp. TaxID=2487775 RepID=A0A3G4ZNN6_9VIRU|nr:MAG: hypothetical protein Terrestrivirus2_99 [Terrestrivirus sp.]